MGAAFPPKATFPLPLDESEVTAFKDAQHRALPASFEELLALHSEQPPTDETIANDPDLTIEDLKFPLRTEWSHRCHISAQPPCLRPKEPSTGYSVLSRRRRVTGNVHEINPNCGHNERHDPTNGRKHGSPLHGG
ncbi:Alpha/Beta hydrolase protein [Penicillium rubens]|nr:Alpha/Beta hydrolase protein [Penicillium rubens]